MATRKRKSYHQQTEQEEPPAKKKREPNILLLPNEAGELVLDPRHESVSLQYVPSFLPEATAEAAFEKLLQSEFDSPDKSKVFVHGKWYQIPRSQAAYGDEGLTYKFSGAVVPARDWKQEPLLLEIKAAVERLTGHTFSYVLVNLYADGSKSVFWACLF